MSIHDSIKRRMEELTSLNNNDDEGFRSFLLALGQEMTQEPGQWLSDDNEAYDDELDDIMHGRGPTGC